MVPFNSLSRDHSGGGEGMAGFAEELFQLPLSGSRLLFGWTMDEVDRMAFNSLSRDHITDDPRVGRENRRVLLSTPSLGITDSFRRGEAEFPARTFNSLSRDNELLRCERP